MAQDTHDTSPQQIDEWIRRAYQPHRQLDELLGSLATSLMHWQPLRGLVLRIDGLKVLRARREVGGVRIDWDDDAAEEQAPMDDAALSPRRMEQRNDGPILYAGRVLGQLTLSWQAGLPELPLAGAGLSHLGAWLGRFCHRYRVADWLRTGSRRVGPLVGTSPSWVRFECFVERAALSDLAVLMGGEFGTEKAWAATAIHLGSRRRTGPLVEVHCLHPLDRPADWLHRAQGGTLFLDGIDELAPTLQRELLGHWLAAYRPMGAAPTDASATAGVRLVATTTANLRQADATPLVARALQAELDYLYAELPALRTRPDDIRFLMEAALERLDLAETPRYTPSLLQACQAYAWPGNLSELERVMACLATMAEGPMISHEDANRHTPWLMAQTRGERAESPGGSAPVPAEIEPASSTEAPSPVGSLHPPEAGPLRPWAASTGSGLTTAPRSASQWVSIVLERQMRVLDSLHPGLRRALLFLSEHFAEPVTLTELSAQAHVSASHLTYLFRSSLGMSFKSFLLCVRIHVAQQLLLQPQLRITEVAMRAGFADLSHFERCFRRAVGRSAREHRRTLAGPD